MRNVAATASAQPQPAEVATSCGSCAASCGGSTAGAADSCAAACCGSTAGAADGASASSDIVEIS